VGKKELKSKIVEMGYSIEALEDEIESLEGSYEDQHQIIAQQYKRIQELVKEIEAIQPQPKYTWKDWCFSGTVDLLPLEDWKRFRLDNSWSYKQLCIGPIRIDCYLA